MRLKKWLILACFIALCEGAGIIGSVFTVPSIPTWYATLIRPMFAPPNWVFGPVWTALFLLMGIAAFLVWQKGFRRHAVSFALGVFAAQLLLNVLWSIIFFGMQNPGLAFGEILFLWLAIAAAGGAGGGAARAAGGRRRPERL